MKRKGFTLIEIIVVIAIIIILIGLVLAGMKHATTTSKENLTIIQLENLQSMLGEADANGGLLPLDSPGFLDNPGDVTKDTYEDSKPGDAIGTPRLARWKSTGVVRSQFAMGYLRRVSTNRQLVQNMTNVMPQEMIGAPYASAPPAPATPINVQSVVAPGYGVPNPPIPADAWGNPIVFVQLSGMKAYGDWETDANHPYKRGTVIQEGTTYIRALKDGALQSSKADTKVWEPMPSYPKVVVSPGHKPFFASAGPDGDFRTTDDNVYSFAR